MERADSRLSELRVGGTGDPSGGEHEAVFGAPPPPSSLRLSAIPCITKSRVQPLQAAACAGGRRLKSTKTGARGRKQRQNRHDCRGHRLGKRRGWFSGRYRHSCGSGDRLESRRARFSPVSTTRVIEGSTGHSCREGGELEGASEGAWAQNGRFRGSVAQLAVLGRGVTSLPPPPPSSQDRETTRQRMTGTAMLMQRTVPCSHPVPATH